MGKSNNKSNVKVGVVAPNIRTKGKKGKRLPEAEVEIQPLPKKLKSTTEVPQKKKHETSSSSEEASELEDEEVALAQLSHSTTLLKPIFMLLIPNWHHLSSDEVKLKECLCRLEAEMVARRAKIISPCIRGMVTSGELNL